MLARMKMHLHIHMVANAMCMLLQIRGEDACKSVESCLKTQKDVEGISTLQNRMEKNKIEGTMLKTGKAEEEKRDFSSEIQAKTAAGGAVVAHKPVRRDTIAVLMQNMDKDNDGFLSLAEIVSRADRGTMEEKEKKMVEKAFNTADSDKDGKLSVAELPVAIKEFEKKIESLSAADIDDAENEQNAENQQKTTAENEHNIENQQKTKDVDGVMHSEVSLVRAGSACNPYQNKDGDFCEECVEGKNWIECTAGICCGGSCLVNKTNCSNTNHTMNNTNNTVNNNSFPCTEDDYQECMLPYWLPSPGMCCRKICLYENISNSPCCEGQPSDKCKDWI